MQTEFSDYFFAGNLMVKVYLCCFTQGGLDLGILEYSAYARTVI